MIKVTFFVAIYNILELIFFWQLFVGILLLSKIFRYYQKYFDNIDNIKIPPNNCPVIVTNLWWSDTKASAGCSAFILSRGKELMIMGLFKYSSGILAAPHCLWNYWGLRLVQPAVMGHSIKHLVSEAVQWEGRAASCMWRHGITHQK